MSSPRAVLVALAVLAVAACSAGPASQPTAVAQVTLPPVTAAPVVTPELATEPPTPAPTPKPTPKPKATPKPVPPKPTGIGWETPSCGLDCGPDDNGGYRVTWKAPRTKGVEIRAYGVTTCFRTKATEGKCLRRSTRLPDDTRMLLAKGPASKGSLALPLVGHGGMNSLGDWCAAVHRVTDDGEPIYSIVIAAYDENGHSNFAIVVPGIYNDGECAVDTY